LAQPVKVMQWNVQGHIGNLASNSTPAALAIARVVNFNQPDVLLFTELQDNGVAADTTAMINWVTNSLPYLSANFHVAISSQGDGFERNGAISRFPISGETTYPYGPRGLHAFQLQLSGSNILQVFHAHLKCCSTGSDCTNRQNEAQSDANQIASLMSGDSVPYIFGGDWNEDEDPRDTPECTLTGFYHPISTIIQTAGLASFEPTTLSGVWRTWSTAPASPSIGLDYMLAATNRLSPVSGYVFSSSDWAAHGQYTNANPLNSANDNRNASDHYPVFVNYSFSTASGQLVVSPATSFISSGPVGGLFTPVSQAYTLSNGGGTAFTWTATKLAPWITLSATSGTLTPGSKTTLTASINPAANNLPAGDFSDAILFSNTTDGNGSTARSVILSPAASALANIQTVFIIMEENLNWSSIPGNSSALYFNQTILPNAAHAEQYYNPPGLHPSLPNYLWLEGGSALGIYSDVDPSAAHLSTTNHLATYLQNAGISWRSYDEDICGCDCPLVGTNRYAPRHNPFVYFDDVTNTNNPASPSCIANVRPYSQLATDLQNNTVARYNFIVPNLCDDMHDGGGCLTGNQIFNGDYWLSNNLPAILSSQAYSNNGAIFILWDEAASGDGPIGMIVLSPLAKPGGYSNSIHYTHGSTLRTMQEIFNVAPFLGDAANQVDLSDLFSFGSQLVALPGSGAAFVGQIGGPFYPASSSCTLSNGGGSVMNWASGPIPSWVTLSATNGVLFPGGTAQLAVSLSATAASLGAGIYSNALIFSNLTSGAGSPTFPVTLLVTNPAAQLSVTPASGLAIAGPPGGPFNPTTGNWTVTNSGGMPLAWSATVASSWLTLSSTNGFLAAGAGTNVTASLLPAANSLPAGAYIDTVSFLNLSNGIGNTTRPVVLSANAFGFFADFSAYASGNLVGQHSWIQLGSPATLPLQVASGQVAVPFGQSADNQDAYKNFTATNGTVFFGMILTVNNAPVSTAPSYFAGLSVSNNGTGFINYRLTAQDAGGGTFAFGARITGQTSDPYTFGTVLPYSIPVMAIVEADSGGTIMKVFVNPTSTNLASQTANVINNIGTATPPNQVASFIISQFASGTAPNAGVTIARAALSDNFATLYTELAGVPPAPVSQFIATPASGFAPLSVAFMDNSTGVITNRLWIFGDGATLTTATNQVSHLYNPGTFPASLVVSGPGGSSTNTQQITSTPLTGFAAWQVQYFGSTTNPNAAPNADPDGDGQNNYAEFLAGTNPTNAASVFKIVSISRENNNLRLTWKTAGAHTNVVQSANPLGSGFSDLSSNVVILGTGDAVTNYLDICAATNTAAKYYRIRLQ
jgi:PKD repeat protein